MGAWPPAMPCKVIMSLDSVHQGSLIFPLGGHRPIGVGRFGGASLAKAGEKKETISKVEGVEGSIAHWHSLGTWLLFPRLRHEVNPGSILRIHATLSPHRASMVSY